MVEYFDEKGIGLLEIMVTMLLVALISSSLWAGFIISQKMIIQAEHETQASSYAFAILEDLRARPAKDWTDILNKSTTDSDLLMQDGNEIYDAAMNATIHLHEKQNSPSLYDVRVTVTWEDGGRNRTLEMVTLVNSGLRGETL